MIRSIVGGLRVGTLTIQALRDDAPRIRSIGWAIDDVEFPPRRLQEKVDQEGFVIIKIRDI